MPSEQKTYVSDQDDVAHDRAVSRREGEGLLAGKLCGNRDIVIISIDLPHQHAQQVALRADVSLRVAAGREEES